MIEFQFFKVLHSCCESNKQTARRYLFNDAEVKPFDSAQLASECFGGEMTVRAAARGQATPHRSTSHLLISHTLFYLFRPKPTTQSLTSSWISLLRR